MANETKPERKAQGTASASRSTAAKGSAKAAAKSTVRRTGSAKTARTGPGTATRTTAAHKTAGKSHRLTKKQKQQRRILTLAVLFLAFAVIVLGVSVLIVTAVRGCSSCDNGHAILPGVSETPAPTPEPITDASVIAANADINGVPVRGLTVAAARDAVKAGIETQMQSVGITVAYDQYSMLLTADKLGMTYDETALEDRLIEAAEAQGRASLAVPLTYDDALLKEALTELNEQLPNHAVNATCDIAFKENVIKSSGETYYQPYFKYTEGVNGMAVDTEDVLRQVEEALNTGRYTAEIRPEVTISAPAVTAADWKKKTTKLSEFSTTYYFTGTSSTDEDLLLNRQNRDINISKAVGLMNVIRLEPGKTFSYNNTTGKRTEKNGWALANAIYKSSHRPEAGGGVCQLSTTMYNALLLANIKIVSRRAHTMMVDYVDKGWDATVDDGHIDFKFQNNTKDTLYVFCYITRNSGSSRKKDIHVEVYGTAFDSGVTYKQRSEIIEVLPITEEYIKDKTMYVSDAPIIERKGAEGYIVMTYIDEYKDKKFVRTVYEESTTYEAITKQIRIGTKADPVLEP